MDEKKRNRKEAIFLMKKKGTSVSFEVVIFEWTWLQCKHKAIEKSQNEILSTGQDEEEEVKKKTCTISIWKNGWKWKT